MMRELAYSVALPATLNRDLLKFLIREDREEDLLFALWTPSQGTARLTALVHTPVFPEPGDRQRHGNVSFNLPYFERVLGLAMKGGYGVAFLHSHPFPGWQPISRDDVNAEKRMAGTVESLTGFPLVGLTVGSDGTWSARFWPHDDQGRTKPTWCESVRSVGEQLQMHFADHVVRRPRHRPTFKRTLNVWGEENHAVLARLRIGIVGLGSVGSVVAEALARMGMTRIILIDFDEVQEHNLDRLLGADGRNLGELKVDVAARQIKRVATAKVIKVWKIPYSLAELQGYRAALDCDVLFSCVDRPRARRILNHLAYAHLIPVVDGGIAVWLPKGTFKGADWQVQTVGPERPCLECLGVYAPEDVALEIEGKLDDPSYMRKLPEEHRLRRNENVFPFSANLASLEVFQFIALVTGIGGIANFGVQRYRYLAGELEYDLTRACGPTCIHQKMIGLGDRHFTLAGQDSTAEAARRRQKAPG